MEYIFGINESLNLETLKTVGTSHSDLHGFQQIVREYPDCTITDSFRIITKTLSKEDHEGTCYDWYTIENHNRSIDKSKQINEKLDTLIISVLEG